MTETRSQSGQQETRRILNVIDPDNDAVGPCVCKLLADLLSPTATGAATKPADPNPPDFLHDVLIVGGSSAERAARSAGLTGTNDRITALNGKAWLSIAPFRKYLAQAGPFDLIQTWSTATLALTALSAPSIPRALYLSTHPSSHREAKWLRILITGVGSNRDTPTTSKTHILAISHSVKRAWVQEGGISPEVIRVLRPGINFGSIRQQERVHLRQRPWKIGSDDVFVIAAIAHPARYVDAHRLAKLLILCGLSGIRTAVVVPGQAASLSTAQKILGSANVPVRFMVDDLLNEPWRALVGCDAVVMTGDDTSRNTGISGTLPLLWAAATGCTIIAEASYAVSELYEHAHSALFVRPGDDRALVGRLREAATDRATAWRLRDAARSEAYSLFSRSRFANDFAIAHQQILANEKIVIPELSSTAGLRFAGLA